MLEVLQDYYRGFITGFFSCQDFYFYFLGHKSPLGFKARVGTLSYNSHVTCVMATLR